MENIKLFPNPVTNQLNIEIHLNSSKLLNIQMFNFLGNLIHTINTSPVKEGSTTFIVDVNNLAPGLYFIKFENKNSIINTKSIVVN